MIFEVSEKVKIRSFLIKQEVFLTRFNKVQIFKIVKLSEQKVRSK